MHRLLDNLPIGMKAFAASAVLLMCLVTLGTEAYLALARSAGEIGTLSTTLLPKRQAISELKDGIIGAHVKVSRFVTWASNGVDAKLLHELRAEIAHDLDGVDDRLSALQVHARLTPEEQSDVQAIIGMWAKYRAAARDTIEVGSTDAPMATMMLGATDDVFQAVSTRMLAFSRVLTARTRSLADGIAADAEAKKRLLAFGGIAGVLLGLGITLAVVTSIVVPIRRVTRAMQEVSSGNVNFGFEGRERRDEIGQMARAIASFRDRLQAQHERFDTALNNMSQGLCMFDHTARLVVCNDRYVRMYNLAVDAVKPGCTLRELLALRAASGTFAGDPDAYVAELLATVAKGKTVGQVVETGDGRSITVLNQPMANGGWVATHEDITDRRRSEARIAHMAHHDGLTDLPNRSKFRQQLTDALARVRRGESLAVLCLDLDHFKSVNDTFGHSIGDDLLKAVADRIRGCVRDVDTIARLGGDEFAVLQPGLERPRDAEALAIRLSETIAAPYEIEGHEVIIDVSIGIALAPNDGTDAEELTKAADIAAYAAKGDGRGTYRFFEPRMDATLKARRSLELDLRRALANGEFELYYQPLVTLEKGEVSCFEALLRWHHPERGLVSPAEFVPVAEEIGLIVALGEWVVRTACAAAAKWPDHVTVAVNISPVQLKARNFLTVVVNALARSGLPARRLELEITESVLMQDTVATLQIMHQLHDIGVRFAMDDFGTGYSSLSYLRSFPFDKIKIDRSFIRDLSDKDESLAIIRAITGLASSLRMSTTIEGVETAEQLRLVERLGCTQVQGYLFSRPQAASELQHLFGSVPAASRYHELSAERPEPAPANAAVSRPKRATRG